MTDTLYASQLPPWAIWYTLARLRGGVAMMFDAMAEGEGGRRHGRAGARARGGNRVARCVRPRAGRGARAASRPRPCALGERRSPVATGARQTGCASRRPSPFCFVKTINNKEESYGLDG